MSNYAADPSERLRRDYTPPHQAPRMPANIVRRPLAVPGHGLPMEPVKAADGFDRLLDAMRDPSRVDQGVDVDAEPEPDSSETEDPGIPFCMACGAILPDHEPTEPCPDCHGDVYDPTAA